MTPDLFPIRDAGKTLKVNAIWLLARCTDTGNYQMVMAPPLEEVDIMSLARNSQYGGLHFNQRDVATLGIELAPTSSPARWKLHMTRPGGGNLTQGQAPGSMEVEDVMLVLGYEWQ